MYIKPLLQNWHGGDIYRQFSILLCDNIGLVIPNKAQHNTIGNMFLGFFFVVGSFLFIYSVIQFSIYSILWIRSTRPARFKVVQKSKITLTKIKKKLNFLYHFICLVNLSLHSFSLFRYHTRTKSLNPLPFSLSLSLSLSVFLSIRD